MRDEVRAVRSSLKEKNVQLASQQPDGAHAPPAAQTAPQTTTNTQKRTAEPPAQAAEHTGGAPQGGATDKQIAYLKVLADRVGADHDEDLWRAADPKRLQQQIKTAKVVKERKGKHTHAALEEAAFRVGVENKIGYREVVQRCECGAARSAIVDRAVGVNNPKPWILAGYLVDYLVGLTELHGPMTDAELSEYNGPGLEDAEALAGRWSAPMTFGEAQHLLETLPVIPEWGDHARLVPADWHTR